MQEQEENLEFIYNFEFEGGDGKTITIKKGEKLILINKRNIDWWEVIRSYDEYSFYVPAGYVQEIEQKPEKQQLQKLGDKNITVIYDFEYKAKDGRLIKITKGEELILIDKTNNDWWKVIKNLEDRSFFVPTGYVTKTEKETQI